MLSWVGMLVQRKVASVLKVTPLSSKLSIMTVWLILQVPNPLRYSLIYQLPKNYKNSNPKLILSIMRYLKVSIMKG